MPKQIETAKKYEPRPYWGCPNCGANTWGAINPMDKELVYRCHGFAHDMITYPGCNTLFRLPQEAKDEMRQELIDQGFEVIDEEKTP